MPSQLDIEEQRWRDAFNEGASGVRKLGQETLDLRAKVERLESEATQHRAEIDVLGSNASDIRAEGTEAAARVIIAKCCAGRRTDELVAAIRAAAKDQP